MFKGSMVALVTPMKADTSLDWSALGKLVEWHLEQGTDAIVAMGTTGESATLDMQDHLEVIRRVVQQVKGRIPVIAGTGANSLSEALELTEGAKAAKADACLLVTPYYNKPSQEGLFLFHQHIARTVAIPQLLYNVPGRTAVDMKAETIARLSREDNIIGIKEATGSMQRLKEIQALVDDQFLLFSGDDQTALEFMELGGHGDISVTANVVPHQLAQMCEMVSEGDLRGANTIQEKLMPLHRVLFVESNPIPVKWALQQMGMIGGGIRLPLTPLDEQFHEQVRAVLLELGLVREHLIS